MRLDELTVEIVMNEFREALKFARIESKYRENKEFIDSPFNCILSNKSKENLNKK